MDSFPQPMHFPDNPFFNEKRYVNKSPQWFGVVEVTSDLNAQSGPVDEDLEYLKQPAPNAIEWITGPDYWNVGTTFQYWGQYQLIRDFFNLRCRICNSQRSDHISCWGKPRSYLEAENLLIWEEQYRDFICPKCRTTLKEFILDGLVVPYNEMVAIVGMRGGKSFTGAHIGGYIEHFLITWGIGGKGTLQKRLGQEKSEWFEMNFAASTATQARKTIYAKYREMRNNSPWIRKYMAWVKAKERAQIDAVDKWDYTTAKDEISDGYLQVRFNRVSSDSAGIAGATRIATFLDEWARLVDTEGTRSAWELYRVLNQGLRTIRSARLLDDVIPYFLGLMAAITSPIADDDPAMQTYTKAKEGVLVKTFVLKKATWEFNPFQPREAFDEEFKRDPVAADRDFGANPPAAATPFITDPVRFWKSIDWEREPVATFLDTYPTDPTGRDYVGKSLGYCGLDSVNTYYLFGDAGVSFDTFALACGHVQWVSADTVSEGEVSPDMSARINPDDYSNVIWPDEIGTMVRPDRGGDSQFISRMYQERIRMLKQGASTPVTGAPYDHRGEFMCTVVDFCLRIIPTHERDVWFDSIVDIIEKLKKQIKIAAVCFDRWNSVSTIQQIRSMGIQSYDTHIKMEDFLRYREMAYNGRVYMLPPFEEDRVSVTDTGKLIIGTSQEGMAGETIALVEMLKLSRSQDLKRVFNPNKGKVRGRDSDDMAHCIVGLHNLVQNSIVDELANVKRRKAVRKRLQASENPMSGGIFKGGRGF